MKHLATAIALLAILTAGTAAGAPMAHPVRKMSLAQCNKLADDRKLAPGSQARADYIKDCRTRKAPPAGSAHASATSSASSPPAQH